MIELFWFFYKKTVVFNASFSSIIFKVKKVLYVFLETEFFTPSVKSSFNSVDMKSG